MGILSGCSLLPTKEVVTKPVPYTHPPLGISPPEPLVLKNVSVILVNPEQGEPYFILEPESYKNLILNNKMIEGYILDAKGRIEACEVYYTRPVE